MRLLNFKLFLLIIYLLSPTIANADQKLDIKNLIIHKDPKKVDNISFKNSEDIFLSLEEFKENLVILNFWATWGPFAALRVLEAAPKRAPRGSGGRLKTNTD